MTPIDLRPSGPPLASIAMVVHRGWDIARSALQALRDRTEEAVEYVLVDNPSDEGTADRMRREIRGATVVENERNVGFGPAANQAAARATARFLVFVNPDIVPAEGWLQPLLRTLEEPAAGAAVPMFLNEDGTVQEAGGLVFGDGSTLMYGHGADPELPRHRFPRSVDYGSAACLAVRRSDFLSVGGFDPAYVPAYCEDVDLQFRLRRRGLRVRYEPRSRVVHARFGSLTNASQATLLVERNTAKLRRRWRGVLAERPDPPRDELEHHRIIAARDADESDRILVVGDRPPERLLLGLAVPGTRVTFLASGLEEVPPGTLERLVSAGIEVEGPLREHRPWWRDRLFHYTAVVVTGPEPRWLRNRLHESQPQASVIDAQDDPARAVAELRRVGLLAEAGGRPWSIR